MYEVHEISNELKMGHELILGWNLRLPIADCLRKELSSPTRDSSMRTLMVMAKYKSKMPYPSLSLSLSVFLPSLTTPAFTL